MIDERGKPLERRLNPNEKLPEPDHPFSKWFGGACAAIWAVGVQSAPDPWNKLLAILTPGIGYIAGQGLDLWFALRLEGEERRKRTRDHHKQISEIRESIKIIERELITARKQKARPETIALYENSLSAAQLKLAEYIQSSIVPK